MPASGKTASGLVKREFKVRDFTAMERQLGLKLESDKGPGDILVIDSVERPSEN